MTTQEGNEVIWQYMHPGVVDDRIEAKLPPYDRDWNWLIPVIIQLRENLKKTAEQSWNMDVLLATQEIDEAMNSLSRKALWTAAIEAIQLLKQLTT